MMKKIYLLIVLIVSLAIFGCQKQEIGEVTEEDLGSGILSIESIPAEADVFVDGVNSGKTPLELSNVKAGQHSIIIKKDGYLDFDAISDVEAGKRGFVEASLVLMPITEEETKNEIIELIEESEKKEPEMEEQDIKSRGNIIPGKEMIRYYDFSENLFTNVRSSKADAFSKKFPSYFIFTRYSPANIKAIDKDINFVTEEDCFGISGEFEYLYSGKSLCIVTRENNVLALGGSWDSTENAELAWKSLS